ncbi:alpha/beta hydrolase [Pseudomonas schmalbachii]|uniref:Alpha/beta hydrolase n=1 Tax=Pseudomonas schmalbachii TaxID=2816993 RepID=A0ABS3TTE7_9PSED|nr:alpha/beta hydrolase [Pseudomonas schmalbachii]MBO3275834.1 alpha/beta hydrolase [Pseudomonas schmalbachii]
MNNKNVQKANHNEQPEIAAVPALKPLRNPAGLPKLLRAEQPDREARAFLRILNLPPRPSSTSVTPKQLNMVRQGFRAAALSLGRRPVVPTVIEREIDGPGGKIALRVFIPVDVTHATQFETFEEPLPAFLWSFGGGFVIGDLDTADSICRNVALAAGCIVVAVRYRLAPEHDLTASREDVLATLLWLEEHGGELGIDTTRLALGGDSAGGNLSAVVAQEYVRRGGTALKMQVLVYPATDLKMDTIEQYPSFQENVNGGYFLTAEAVEMIDTLLEESKNELDLSEPRFSPIRAKGLSGQPPAVVLTAGFDPIRDQGIDYAVRLRDAGVPVELLHYAGQFHGFLNFDSVLGAGRDALQRIGDALAMAFCGEEEVDRTVEIADETGENGRILHTVGEVATASLTVWRATVGWRDTLLRMASPTAASACKVLLTPWSLPTALVRRRISKRINPVSARQTYPQWNRLD